MTFAPTASVPTPRCWQSGLPSSRGGEAIDVAVLTHAQVRSIPVDRPAFRVIIGGGLAPAVTALIGKLFMSAG